MNKLYEYLSYNTAKCQILEETSVTGSKDMFMVGVFIQGNVRNHNKRVYPAHEIERAVRDINLKLKDEAPVPGELDHPLELSINLDRVSHYITDMWMEGSNGHGKLKIVDTPMGTIAKTLLKSGLRLGVSSRGSGDVDDYGNVSNFEIVTVDIVAQPSAPNAYPKTIYESLFNMKGGSNIHKLAENAKYDTVASKYLEKDILQFIKELKK